MPTYFTPLQKTNDISLKGNEREVEVIRPGGGVGEGEDYRRRGAVLPHGSENFVTEQSSTAGQS